MTCVVGIEHGDGAVTLGGDSAAVAGSRLSVRVDEKVFHVGPYLIGFEDSFRMGQLLRYRLKVPPQRGDDDFKHMATAFIDSARRCFAAGGFTKVDSNEESGGVFLVGYRGRLYSVDSDFHVGRVSCGYDAIGCGQEFAIGALSVSTGTPRRRVERALIAAERNSTGVRGPFTILTMEG